MIELIENISGAPGGLNALLDEILREACRLEGVPECDACVLLTGDEEIHALNRSSRGVDAPTDVLSFPAVRYPSGTARDHKARLRRETDPETGRAYLGDMAISLPRAQAQAVEYGHAERHELGYLAAHAVLHLMGYDHEDERGRAAMREMEEAILRAARLPRDSEYEDEMKTLAIFDRKDYDLSLPRIIRHSVRAIIIEENKVALLYSHKYGIYVFPGGNIEDGETHIDALIRETKEEAGLIVKPRSIQAFGAVTEIRKDTKEENIFEQRDYFYTCDVESMITEQHLTAGEKESGYQLQLVSLDKAISINEGNRREQKWVETETYVLKLLRGDSDMDDHSLFQRACEALQRAYAPYSNFRVGACILAEDGRAFTGCNVENASYGATLCAERVAAAKAVSGGARSFTAIAVAGEFAVAWPCGVCRQFLNEFAADGMRVIVGKAGGEFEVAAFSELLPHAFGPKELKK